MTTENSVNELAPVTQGEKKQPDSKRQLRSIQAREITIGDDRTIEFPFSSEEPVARWFGDEVLSHEKGAADMTRLNDGAPLLFNHNMDDYIGVVEKAWIGDDKRAYARVRFATHERAQQIMDDVNAGILRNVSFAYEVRKYVEDKKSGTFTGTDWRAYEVSFVTVPADQTVGVGRALIEEKGSEAEMPSDLTDAAAAANSVKGVTMSETTTTVDVSAVAAQAAEAERQRIAGINALGEKFAQRDLARQLVDGGKSLEEARAIVLERMGDVKPVAAAPSADIGLTKKEVRSYSFMRAINALANPGDRAAYEAAAFEREVSEAAAKAAGKSARGIFVPGEILRAKRDLNVGTATAGGNVVATDLMADAFIDLLRNRSVVQRAGATVMNGLVGNVAIPKQTGAATAYWVAESGAPTESQQTVGQVTMTPKTVGAYTDFSRRLILQSSIDVENMVRNDLAQVIALAIDSAALYGTGSSNQPTGLKLQSGINTKDFAAATPTFAELIAMESEVASDNADVGTMRYLINAAMRGSLKSTPKFGSGTEATIWEQGNTVNGYGTEVSNQLQSGDVFFGNFADLILGFWSGLDLMVDPYAGSTSGTVRVVALQDVDIAVRNAVSFCYGNGSIA
jgi:HK97 family phage major capsid protein/HK97 family phage prohead protease